MARMHHRFIVMVVLVLVLTASLLSVIICLANRFNRDGATQLAHQAEVQAALTAAQPLRPPGRAYPPDAILSSAPAAIGSPVLGNALLNDAKFLHAYKSELKEVIVPSSSPGTGGDSSAATVPGATPVGKEGHHTPAPPRVDTRHSTAEVSAFEGALSPSQSEEDPTVFPADIKRGGYLIIRSPQTVGEPTPRPGVQQDSSDAGEMSAAVPSRSAGETAASHRRSSASATGSLHFYRRRSSRSLYGDPCSYYNKPCGPGGS